MKPLLISLAVLAIASTCCLPTVVTPMVTNPPATEPPVTEPPVITEIPVVTEPPVSSHLPCEQLSISIDPALASGYTCEILPQNLIGLAPEYPRFTLTGYALAYEWHTAYVDVIPVAAFIVLNSGVPASITELQALVAGGTPGNPLPYLPDVPANQEFHAHLQALSFGNGYGIRYLTQFIQMEYPVTNAGLVYVFQGLTNDGEYWISVQLPVSNPSLPANGDILPGGQTMEQFHATFNTYVAEVTAQIEGFPDNTFQPSLTALDTLISSITILP